MPRVLKRPELLAHSCATLSRLVCSPAPLPVGGALCCPPRRENALRKQGDPLSAGASSP